MIIVPVVAAVGTVVTILTVLMVGVVAVAGDSVVNVVGLLVLSVTHKHTEARKHMCHNSKQYGLNTNNILSSFQKITEDARFEIAT